MHYVIVGNGAAGVSALQTIRDVDQSSKITIISKEPYPAYSPCSLPNLISGEIDKDIIFRFEDNFYKHLEVTFLKSSNALKIQPSKNKIQLSTGKNIHYDKLLVSAGAKPITPRNLQGFNLHGVYVMGSLDSTIKILNHIKQGVNHVVVVGGGFMGVETATNLKKRKIEVSIVEMLPRILSRMLDSDISYKVQEILKEHGIELILNSSVDKIVGKKNVRGVIIGDKFLECDMIVFAIGVKPNIDIVKNTNIKTNHGIKVDSNMKTNIENIYAAGDIVEVWDQIQRKKGTYAIWPNAIEQGKVAGFNMVGIPTTYAGAEIVNVLDIFDSPVVAIGLTSEEVDKCKIISRFTQRTSKKLILKNNKIVGLQFIGTLRNIGTFHSLMKKGSDISTIEDRLLDDNFVIAPKI